MKPNKKVHPQRGFALVVTLTLMVLLSILALGLLSLSSVSLRTMGSNSSVAVARSNARMAMLIAIGQLQMHAGPDQRVTATASLNSLPPEEEIANPQWIGSWKTGPGNEDSTPVWLISGESPDPATQLGEDNSALLSSIPDSDPTRKELRAPFVNVNGSDSSGRYAYWIGDEGTRARVDIGIPQNETSTSSEKRYVRSQSPGTPGLTYFDESNKTAWAAFDSSEAPSIVSMDTVAFATGDGSNFGKKEIAHHYFNDLTTGGFGLPVNVRDGGMKTDLSVLFDKSLESRKTMLSSHIGAVPSPLGQTYEFLGSVTDKEKFFLSPSISSDYTKPLGPNWGSLYSYARSWENVSNNSTSLVGPYPRPSSDLRQANWIPYDNTKTYNQDSFVDDFQHANSGLHPVICMTQLTFRIASSGPLTGSPTDPPNGTYYIPRLEIKPVIGIWNPYNVAIKNASYLINWAIAPYLRLAHDGYGTDVTEMWLREYWTTGNGQNGELSLPTENSQGGGYFNLQTSSTSFAPGEIKYFSINKQEPLAAIGGTNKLVPSWGEAGGFYMDIRRSTKHTDGGVEQPIGSLLRVPAGRKIWFGSIFLQDTHMDDQQVIEWPGGVGTRAHFGSKIGSRAASSWLTLKSGSYHLNRYTNLWNGGTDESMGIPVSSAHFMPEPVRHSKWANADTSRSYSINNLGAGDVGHLASWRFMNRNTTQGQRTTLNSDPDQGLRGWIDSNPRPMSSSVRFDGSKTKSGGTEGWNMVSNFIGDTNDYPSVMGDRQGGSRGLISEGQLGIYEPEADTSGGGYRGLGGASITSVGGGTSHVIIYDVPRTPLTSVGQFQHAELSRYNYEPGFVVGNSYANIRIPPGQTKVENFAGVTDKSKSKGMLLVDSSYEVNQRLWDSVFFSTLSPDYVGKSGSSFDSALNYSELSTGKMKLPNPRMVFAPLSEDTSIDTIIKDAADLAPEAIASRILIQGAFNVNSTSKEAWKAILSTLGDSELPIVGSSASNPTTTWADGDGIRFNRFSFPGEEDPFVSDDPNSSDAIWRGWRKLTADELETLATEIVKEVKLRGPFRSMAEFVNRDPGSTDSKQQLKGALQAALDRTANQNLPATISPAAKKPAGSQFTGTITNEQQTAGYAGNILQGDILQSLAPILQVRSDYFRIRTCGEALDKDGKTIAKAYCEAYVQRYPEYVDSAEKPETSFDDLTVPANIQYGRGFRVVSFRWLSPSEI